MEYIINEKLSNNHNNYSYNILINTYMNNVHYYRKYSEAPVENDGRENIEYLTNFNEISESKSEINVATSSNSNNSVENEILKTITNYHESSPNIEYELDPNDKNSQMTDEKVTCVVNVKSDIDLYKNVIQLRDIYMDFHLSNPGIFYETVRQQYICFSKYYLI